MHRLLELILGLEKGFLRKQGDLTIQFNPQWPSKALINAGQVNFLLGLIAVGVLIFLFTRPRARGLRGALHTVAKIFCVAFLFSLLAGAVAWNVVLSVGALALIGYVYFHESRSLKVRIGLGIVRAALLAFLLVLLNLPILTLTRSRSEPSVLGILIDDTISMGVHDAGIEGGTPQSRIEAVIAMADANHGALLRELSKKHQLRFFRFEQAEHPIASMTGTQQAPGQAPQAPTKEQAAAADAESASALKAIDSLKAVGTSTQVVTSVSQALEDLQGQRVAGLVVLTDGRDTPSEALGEGLAAVKSFGIKVYPIPVGSDKPPRNIDIQSVDMQDSAFKGDIVNLRTMIHVTGYENHHAVQVRLRDKKTGQLLRDADGLEVEKTVYVDNDKPQEVELPFKASEIGTLDVSVEVVKQAGQLDATDNIRTVQLSVLDAKINVLYVDGYPRWDYRNIKLEMIREPTVNISCLLLSADPGFPQEHSDSGRLQGLKYFPYHNFPETMEQIMECDVVIFGDVDPRQFTGSQLQLVSDFVSQKGGGFGMVAGPQFSPQAFRNTPIESILPVNITHVHGSGTGLISQGFRPQITKVGEESSIFRFFTDKARNDHYLQEEWPEIFWYCQGVTVKPGVGEVYAQHPTETGPNGHKAPLLVMGRFGAGRTLFSAIDDSWRWRYYTGESIFNTYWVQQIRYLARSKKLGERRVTFTSLRPSYENGEQVRLSARILDGTLLPQLPPQLGVQILDGSGQVVRHENLVRQEGQSDLYTASFTADHAGKFTAMLPSVASGVNDMTVPLEIIIPRLELAQPEVDHTLLSRLASETLGQVIPLSDAPTQLISLIPSAAKTIPDMATQPLWDAPLALIIFVLLITFEWVLRKVNGML